MTSSRPSRHDSCRMPAPTDGKATAERTCHTDAPSHPLQFIVFSNLQILDAEFTDSIQVVPGTTRTFVGNEPAYAPDVVFKGGITFKRDKCFNVTFSGVYVSEQFWQDSNIAGNVLPVSPAIPAKIPSYEVFNLSGEFYVTRNRAHHRRHLQPGGQEILLARLPIRRWQHRSRSRAERLTPASR